MPLSPFDWSGPQFLIFYLALFAVAILASLAVPRLLRPAGRAARVTDPVQLARLAGGEPRAIAALATARLASGEWRLAGNDRYATALGDAVPWKRLQPGLRDEARRAERTLAAAGLLADEDDARTLTRWATWPLIATALIGAAKVGVGVSRDRPVGLLLMLIAFTLLVLVVRWHTVDRRTDAGHALLARARDTHDRLRRAPLEPEMGLAVALFGTATLAGSQYAPFHDARRGSDGGGGDSGSSSDSGGDSSGDGGCGGGCGGCGGGGD